MEKHRRANDHSHGAESAHSGHRRLLIAVQRRAKPPSGQRVQREEDHAAEQAHQNRRFIAAACHGGGRDTGGDHGHGCFQQQEEQADPVGPLRDQPDDAGHREAEQRAPAAGEQQAHGADARQQRRRQTPPDTGGVFQEVEGSEQR